MGVHLKIAVRIYKCDMMMACIQILEKALTTCKKKKKAQNIPSFFTECPWTNFQL
jgi:hypothetical protein